MTGTHSSSAARLAKQESYRKLMFGVLVAGIIASIALRVGGFPLVGEGVYWVGIIGFVGIWFGTSVSLFDERDVQLEQRASQFTLYLAGVILVVGASSARVYATVTDTVIPPAIDGALYALVGVFVLFGLSFVWVRYRA